MEDIGKVIEGVHHCYEVKGCDGCQYEEGCAYSFDNDEKPHCPIMDDIIDLLKEHEAVKPHYNARTNWYECGACHYSMTSGMHCRNELIPAYKVGFCAKCGKEVKWS